jgi:hypothetical protein
MVIVEKLVEWRLAGETCPSATLSATNPIWPDPGSNPGCRGGKPATNRLSYGAAISIYLSIYLVSSSAMHNALTGSASYEDVLLFKPSGAVRQWRYAEQMSWCLITSLKMMNSFQTSAHAQWSCRLCFSRVEWSNNHFKSNSYRDNEIISHLNSISKYCFQQWVNPVLCTTQYRV